MKITILFIYLLTSHFLKAQEVSCSNWSLQQKELSIKEIFESPISSYWVKERFYSAENKFDPRNGELFTYYMLFLSKIPQAHYKKFLLEFNKNEAKLLNDPNRFTSLSDAESKLIIKNIFHDNIQSLQASPIFSTVNDHSSLENFIHESHQTFLSWLHHLPYIYGGSSIRYIEYFWGCENDALIHQGISSNPSSFFYLNPRERKILDKFEEQKRIENLLTNFQPFFVFLTKHLSPKSNLTKKISNYRFLKSFE